jgi:potassium-dependent mechanosensitive channel
MRALRSLALGLAVSAIWPSYLVLLAYTARQAPWPRSVGILVSAILSGVAITVFVHEFLRWLTRPDGWAECHMELPREVARQLGRAARFTAVSATVLLLPVYLFDHALIAPEGRALHALALCRFLIIAFELVVFATCFRLLRGDSPLMAWLTREQVAPSSEGTAAGLPSTEPARTTPIPLARLLTGLRWLSRGRRLIVRLILVGVVGVIVLDVRGYSFTAKRIALGGTSTAIIIAAAVMAYRASVRAIEAHAARWARPTHLWAVAFTSVMGRRASSRSVVPGLISVDTTTPQPSPGDAGDDQQVQHLAAALQHLAAVLLTLLGLMATAWAWDLDLALVRFLLSRPIWPSDENSVTFGDLTQATLILVLGLLAWRNVNALFSLAIFSRIPDDPGVRFAIVTLCRYAALGLTTIAALSSVHFDMAKISVVLAALGVGLGFGLQEIVSNFVCGIILLLERPIRIGDIVTVGGTTGTVDRINIRATTIINSDNQCMIVPNREFITGNLVNWTHKDKIIRVSIKLRVAYGTDPDRVVTLLSAIARLDNDVLFDPLPSASLESFGDSALMFGLYVFVADPSLAGPVRHRLCSEIHRRFEQEGIVMPFPTQQLFFDPAPPEWSKRADTPEQQDGLRNRRADQPERTPPARHAAVITARSPVADESEPS